MIQIEVIKCREDYKENMRDELIKEFSEQLTDDKQKKVFEILVCPIVASKDVSNIGLYSNVFLEKIIISSQEYDGNVDEDMCDFAIGFYEILYGFEPGDILAQSKDKNKKSIKDWEYAGDTMNSYATVSRYASKEKKKEWKETYHCLANFWMLPGVIGRYDTKKHKCSKQQITKPAKTVKNFNLRRRDYVDRFLNALSEANFREDFKADFGDYADKFKLNHDIVNFAKKHHIKDLINDAGEVILFSTIDETMENLNERMVDAVIDSMESNVCKRAVSIVTDDVICNKLFDYFNELRLI